MTLHTGYWLVEVHTCWSGLLTAYLMQAVERMGAHHSPPPPLAALSTPARSPDKQEGTAEKPSLGKAKASARLSLTPCTAGPALLGR